MAMNLMTFEPGVCIELDDTMKGFRKLGMVTQSGDMYMDEGGPMATPFPIYAASNPKSIGNVLSWGLELADADSDAHAQFVVLHDNLQVAGVDVMTLNRALYWAFQNRVFELRRCLAEADAASAKVRESRTMMDQILSKAAQTKTS